MEKDTEIEAPVNISNLIQLWSTTEKNVKNQNQVTPTGKRASLVQKRTGQPSVLSRIRETPIWESNVLASSPPSPVEKRGGSVPNSTHLNVTSENPESQKQFAAVIAASNVKRRGSLPVNVKSPLHRRNSVTEIEILRSRASADIPANNQNNNIPSFQRIPCFASILVMGLAGSGKSSTINTILSQNVAPVKKPFPEMHEYITQVKVPDALGFYALRIIDCPGYTNNSNNTRDASFLTTLLSYLDSKDGLRGRMPSLVLIVLKFDSVTNPKLKKDLINFLKTINHFQRHFNNIKFPNFIFVLTHFKSANLEDQKNPYVKCQLLQNLIEAHTTLPIPAAIVCVDNKDLLNKKQNNFVEIMNDEFYPTNLIERMKKILTRKGRDSISETIIRTAFGVDYPESIVVTERNQIRLLDENHPTVINTNKILEQIYADLEWTELSILLQIGWENIELKLRRRYPSALLSLQRILQISKIRRFDELPDNSKDTLDLIRDLPQNFAIADLLIHTLQLRIPECYPSKFVGLGYDVRSDCCTDFSPFEFSDKLLNTPLGLMSHEIECELTNDRLIAFKFFHSYQEYIVERLRDLKIRTYIFPDVNVPNSHYKRIGYNIVKPNQDATKAGTVTASIEYRVCRLEMQERLLPEFKAPFWEAVTQLPHIDPSNSENVYAWKGFFGFWGTHVIKSGYVGGSVEVTFKGKILSNLSSYLNRTGLFPSDDDEISRVFQWITGDGLEIAANGMTDSKMKFIHAKDSVTACFKGGDEKFQDCDITKVLHEMVAEMRDEWKESLIDNPVFLETNLNLIPLSHYVRNKCPETATKMDVAFQFIFSNYIPQEGKNSSCSIL